jgi:hypothetical protein
MKRALFQRENSLVSKGLSDLYYAGFLAAMSHDVFLTGGNRPFGRTAGKDNSRNAGARILRLHMCKNKAQ